MRKSVVVATCWLCALLAHAQTQTSDPLLDFSWVVPPAPERHVLTRPVVLWEVRVDAPTRCEQVKEHDGFAVWREGCVYWSKSGPGCTIVTTAKTTHSLMGRLFLLCVQAGQSS